MSEKLVLDASVALKWFLKEESSKKALRLQEKIISGETLVYVPQIFFFEVPNVLKTKSTVSVGEILEVLEIIYGLELKTELVTKEPLAEAVTLAEKYNLSVYDASYLALAKLLGINFLTADKKLKEKVGFSFIETL